MAKRGGDHGEEIQKASENLDDFEVSGRGSDKSRMTDYGRGVMCGSGVGWTLTHTSSRDHSSLPDVTRAP